MKVKSEGEITQSCPTLSDPKDCSLLGSSVHGIFQARVLEWGAIGFSRVSYNRCQFWHYLLEVNVWCPSLRAQSYKKDCPSPTYFSHQLQVQVVTCVSDQLAINWRYACLPPIKLWCWRRCLRVPWTTRRSSQSVLRKSTLNIHWKSWCWSWSSSSLANWCEEPTHWKRPWYWERLRAGGERGDRGWDGWMASLTQETWVWTNSVRWWRTGNLVRCIPWGHKELDMIEQPNNNKWLPRKIQPICWYGSRVSEKPFAHLLLVYYRRYNEGHRWTPAEQRCTEQGTRGRAQGFHDPFGHANLPIPPHAHWPGSTQNLILLGFLRRLHHTDMINY